MSTISEPSSSSTTHPPPTHVSAERARGRNRVMRRRRIAKIVATLGPASAGGERIRALFDAGVDVFRLNFSHGTHDQHRARFAEIRQVESDTGRPIGILADLQGPKLRLGNFAGGKAEIVAGGHFRLDLDKQPGDQNRAPLPHPEVFEALTPGTELLLDDGKVRLRVAACGADFADTEILVGGTLSDHKGVNVPGVVLAISAMTDKDRADLSFALQQGADWVALSFVQRPEDVAEGRKLIGNAAGLMVKLEKPAAISRLDEIIDLADALMVARGDLGVEMQPEHTDRDAISAAACQVAETIGAAAIVSFTSSGATALRAARERPAAPILAVTPNIATARRLALLWGAHCVHLADITSFGDMVQKAVRTAHREEIAGPGQRVVITAGVPFGTPGSTNILRIAWVER